MYWYQVSILFSGLTPSALLTFPSSFAWAEMRVVAANILSRYDVEEVPGQNLDWRQYVTIQLSDGHWRVMLKPRWKNFDD